MPKPPIARLRPAQRRERTRTSFCALLALAVGLAACTTGVARCGTPTSGAAGLAPLAADLADSFADIPFRSKKSKDSLSDVAFLANGEALLVSDEGTEIGLARPEKAGKKGRALDVLAAFPDFARALGGEAPKEIDYEAAAADGARVLIAGSASLKRLKPEEGADNVARLREVKLASGEGNPHSNYLLELEQASDGSLSLVRSLDLRRLLLSQPALETFADLPSKENGLDVEGIALRGGTAYVGLRGPVLRGHAVVARVELASSAVSLDFLALGGLGIRGMCSARDGGFWILAGPTLDVSEPFAVYHWDGSGSAFAFKAEPALVHVLDLVHPTGEKPEGIFERGDTLCILHEGARGGGPRCTARPRVP